MTQPAAPATVTLPAVGRVQRRWVVIGALAVVGIVGYAYFVRARSTSELGFDPATGTPGGGSGAYVNPDPDGPPGPGGGDDPALIMTNDQWGAKAVEALIAAGWDAQFAALAIGLYLDGQELTTEQWNAVRAARAIAGRPPVDLPLKLRQAGATASGGGGATYGGPILQTQPQPPKQLPVLQPRRYVIVTTGSWRGSLLGIANHVGRSILDLMVWNALSSARTFPGQKIWIDPPGRPYRGEMEITS